MKPEDSIVAWIGEVRAGRHDAARQIWERYFTRMVDLARGRLHGRRPGGLDAEDVAQSVFKSLFLRLEQGGFPDLVDHDDLWNLLIVMTRRKAKDYLRSEMALKRGGGMVQSESWWLVDPDSAEGQGIDQVADRAPPPEVAVLLADEIERLLALLPDDPNADLRAVAALKLEAHSNAAIANQLKLSERTVERRLQAIRDLWQGSEAK
jgi:RNA polymerase sigma factor (sigma-70 family)